MAQATLTTLDPILKEVYGPRIENQLNDEVTALKRLERTSEGVVETVGGKYVDFPIKITRNHGIGYRAEGEQLPAANKPGYSEVHVSLKYGYGHGQITGQAMELAEKNYQAFASALDESMDDLKVGLAKDSGRIAYGDGTGLLASITADGGTDNQVVVDTTQYLEEGMVIDIRVRSTGDTTAGATNRTITAINDTTLTVTYDGADVDPDNTYGLYREGNYASGTTREPVGLARIVDDDTILHGVNPSTVGKWKATVMENSGTNRALSEGLMIEMMDNIRRVSGSRPSVIFGGLGVRRAYFNLLTQQRRYADTKTFAGGFQGLAFNYGTEVPMVEDLDAPSNKMFFVSEDKIKIYRNRPWHWMDTEGSIMKWVSQYDSYEFLMRQYWEIGTSERNAHGRIDDLTEG